MAKEVGYKLKLDSSEFSKGLADATSSFGSFTRSIVEGVGIGVGINLGETIGAGIKTIVSAIPAGVSALADLGDNLVALEAKTGIGVEALQEFSFAGKLANVEVTAIAGSMNKFQQAMAGGSDKAASGLSRIGLTFSELRGLAPEAQLSAIAAGFEKITDPALRTKAAVDIFGKSGAEMLKLFDGGLQESMAVAERYGLVLSENLVRSAAETKDQFDTMTSTIEAMAMQIVGAIVESESFHVFLDGLTEMLGELGGWVARNKDELRAWVDMGIVFAANALTEMLGVLEVGLAVVKVAADGWALLLFQMKSAGVVAGILKNIIGGMGVKEAFAQGAKEAAQAEREFGETLKANQEKLDAAIGVTSRMKEGTEALTVAVSNASGKVHQAKDRTFDYNGALTQNAAAAKAAAKAAEEFAKAQDLVNKGAENVTYKGLANETQGAIHKDLMGGFVSADSTDLATQNYLVEQANKRIEETAKRKEEAAKAAAEAAKETFKWADALQIASNTMNTLGISADSFFGQVIGGALSAGAAIENMMKSMPKTEGGLLNFGAMTTKQKLGAAGTMLQVGAGIYAGASSNTGKAVAGGAVQGALAGGMTFGVPGAIIGGLAGGVMGLFGSGAKKKKELEEMRTALVDEFGGSIDAVKAKAQELGVNIEKAFSTKSPKEAKAAIDELHSAMKNQETVIAGASMAMEAQNARAKMLFESVKSGALAADQAGVSFDNLGVRMMASFSAMVQQTGDVVGALMQIGPGLEQISLAQTELGIEASATTQFLVGMYSALQSSGMGEQIQLLNQEMKGLADAGIHSQAVFTAFGSDASSMFAELSAKTGDQGLALAMMQPSLQRLWEMQKDYGYAVDESTAAMLKQAEEQGVVGDQMRSTQEKILQVLLAIAQAAGAAIPEGFARAQDAADSYGKTVAGLPSPPAVPSSTLYPANNPGDANYFPTHGFMGFVPAQGSGATYTLAERGRGEWIVPEGQESHAASMWGEQQTPAVTDEVRMLRMDMVSVMERLPLAFRDALLLSVGAK